MKQCKYPDCKLVINSPHNTDYCLFHSPIDKKGIDENEFTKQFIDHVRNTNSYNFTGFIFPLMEFTFVLHALGLNSFQKDTIFDKCRFEGRHIEKGKDFEFEFGVFFKDIVFNANISFEEAEFVNGAAVFTGATFNGNKANFKNAAFLKGAYFNKANFKCNFIDFSNTQFRYKETIFSESTFENFNTLSFNNSIFNSELVEFNNSKFIGRDVTFRDSLFESNKIHFENNNFECIILSFDNSVFKGGIFLFKESQINTMVFSFENVHFENGNVAFAHIILNKSKKTFGNLTSFDKSSFKCKMVTFANILFNCSSPTFKEVKFETEVIFIENEFKDGATFESAVFGIKDIGKSLENENIDKSNSVSFLYNKLYKEMNFDKIFLNNNLILAFANLEFYDESALYFNSPNLLYPDSNVEKDIVITFERIDFKPYKTFFENIGNELESVQTNFPFSILIRYCDLQNVYFTNSQMSLFSFYKSIFDEAIFVSCRWISEKSPYLKLFKYDRNNILFEDLFYNKLENKELTGSDKAKFDLDGLNSREDIADMYRGMKVSLDKTKDYQKAGGFYFNEYEMLRLNHGKAKGLLSKCKFFLYTIYKYLSGYGERPLWAFYWLMTFTFMISALNMLNGFRFRNSEIDYDLIPEPGKMYSFNTLVYLKDIIKAIFFTISRVLPTSYIPIDKSDFGPIDSIGIMLGILTAFILFFFITMIFSGLKRHFRRF